MSLAIFFFITALIYAAIGFGGGSTYNALLALTDTDYRILPIIALICNLIVVSGGIWHFAKAGHIQLNSALPWMACSVPAAWIGGLINLSETVFIGVLGLALLVFGLRMLYAKEQDSVSVDTNLGVKHRFIPPLIGGILGLLAGVTGIGGGIFLAPILHLRHWGSAKHIAGTCSLFIFANAVAGLIGQITKLGNAAALSAIWSYWPLFPAVMIGGQMGSWLGVTRMNTRIIKRLTALLILYVAVRLLYRLLTMLFSNK